MKTTERTICVVSDQRLLKLNEEAGALCKEIHADRERLYGAACA